MNPALVIDEVTVTFGGLRALHRVSIEVPEATVAGLIGPNGAGKSTLFDVVSGFRTPDTGRVLLFGEDVTDRPPDARARSGLGRTFQRVETFRSLTVRENLAVAATADGGDPARVDAILERLALTEHAHAFADELPLGLARQVELGRALCASPSLLLLDEPSSGLRQHESGDLGHLLTDLRDTDGLSVLVVEHDMRFVLGISDHVTVLDFGEVIAQGTPTEIAADERVRAAYLGEEFDGAIA